MLVTVRFAPCLCALLLWSVLVRPASAAPVVPALDARGAAILASISTTIYRYGLYTDVPNRELFADTFTAGAVLESSVATGQVIPTVTGRDAIVDFIMKQRAKDNDTRRHQIDNIWIERLEGKRAKVRAYYVLTVLTAKVPELRSTGSYEFDMVQEADGVWRIDHEKVVLDAPAFQ